MLNHVKRLHKVKAQKDEAATLAMVFNWFYCDIFSIQEMLWMCGIAGAVNFKKYNLKNLLSSLSHRGPDDQQIYTDNQIALVHTRLAIQDRQGGIQPLLIGDYVIVFNGEIYNHFELRKLLDGCIFKTKSDTETLLCLYIKYKQEMLHFLDGMFAFAIYDKKENVLFLARDRAGKKPLYYVKTKESFLFASELNSIKSIYSPTIDEEAIGTFLRTGFFYNTMTPYTDIQELSAGSCSFLSINSLSLTFQTYFQISNYYAINPTLHSKSALLTELDQRLCRSVQDRLLSSDLEVGVLLSGGIDSNLIVAIASRYQKNIKTFTVKFPQGYDESSLARLTAEKFKTDHHEVDIGPILDKNLKFDIEKILCNYGEPFMDSSAIPCYYVAMEAKRHVTVVLTGDGADELFAGYRRYVPEHYRWMNLFKYVAFLKEFIPKPHNKKTLYNYFHRLLCKAGKTGIDHYLSITTDIFEDVYSFPYNSHLNEFDALLRSTDKIKNALSKALALDFNMLLGADLLVKMDIASMAHALEARSPFLSKYMLEFAPVVPANFKIRALKTKYLLRVLAQKYLPEVLVSQPKRGFEIPLRKWVDNELKDIIFSYLDRDCYALKYIDQKFLKKILSDKITISAEKRAKILWSLFCLEVWYKNDSKMNGNLREKADTEVDLFPHLA